MRIKYLYRVIFIGLMSLFLVACHSGVWSRGGGNAQEQEGMAARSMGLGDSEDFVEQRGAQAFPQAHHTLRAPADQMYYFNLASSVVQRSDIPSLDMQANYLIRHRKAHVRIEGHTDERGSREYNIALGWRRAKRVARLMQQLGVGSKQLTVVSYGREKPAVRGHDESAWRFNRRVRLIYEVR